MSDWSKQFKDLLNSPLGQELIRTLEQDLAASIIEDARKANEQEKAFAFLNKADGVMLAIGHLKFKSQS